MTDQEHEQAFARYERGEISLETLAARTEMSLLEVLSELRERDIHLQYTEESLREDTPQRYGAFSELDLINIGEKTNAAEDHDLVTGEY